MSHQFIFIRDYFVPLVTVLQSNLIVLDSKEVAWRVIALWECRDSIGEMWKRVWEIDVAGLPSALYQLFGVALCEDIMEYGSISLVN
jgi:hypothetical protein